ncbi:MAG: GNAT family N-acetyltransferase [Treponema sp.]|jgi:predicted GNAT family acetyltransferase|nr:GNAT family N-acetyltransferase [Treponema sp.]
MIKVRAGRPYARDTSWERLGRRRFEDVKELLRRRELFCVPACARFLRPGRFSGQVWGSGRANGSANGKADGSIGALIFHTKGSLFPILAHHDTDRFSMPPPLLRFLKKTNIYAVQGLRNDVLTLQRIMGEVGKQSTEAIDYDLMVLNREPSAETLRAGPPEISIREPEPGELEDILPLQSAYEQEEVLPQGAVFNVAVCRVNLKRILKEEKVLVAELGGQIIAKVNTSAISFTRTQIGGVFVHPSCRGLGIARRICAELTRTLVNTGRGVNLYVKKWNQSARLVYQSIGFRSIADYRITYYR